MLVGATVPTGATTTGVGTRTGAIPTTAIGVGIHIGAMAGVTATGITPTIITTTIMTTILMATITEDPDMAEIILAVEAD